MLEKKKLEELITCYIDSVVELRKVDTADDLVYGSLYSVCDNQWKEIKETIDELYSHMETKSTSARNFLAELNGWEK